MPILKPQWKPSFVAGALIFTGTSFFISRPSLLSAYPWLAPLVGLGVLMILWRLKGPAVKREAASWRQRISTVSKHALSFLVGMILAGVLIYGLGYGRLAWAEAMLAKSGVRYAMPANDVQDRSEKNGVVILERLADDKVFEKNWNGDDKTKGLVKVYGSVIKQIKGEEKIDASSMKELRARRAEFATALKAVDSAQAAPNFSWNIKYDVPFYSLELPRFAHLLKTTRSLIAEALLLEQEGHSSRAEARLIQALWLSGKVRQNPTLVASMIAVAIEKMTTEAAIVLIRKGKGAAFISALQTGLAETAVISAMSLEFIVMPQDLLKAQKHDLHNFIEVKSGELKELLLLFAYYPWISWDLAAIMDRGLEMHDCLKLSPVSVAVCLREKRERTEKTGWKLQADGFPKFDDMPLKGAECTARQNLALLAHRSVSYKKSRGRWPGSQEDLGSTGQLLDAFTGKPLIMRLKGAQLELISVGSDGQEDGVPAKEGLEKDIVILL